MRIRTTCVLLTKAWSSDRSFQQFTIFQGFSDKLQQLLIKAFLTMTAWIQASLVFILPTVWPTYLCSFLFKSLRWGDLWDHSKSFRLTRAVDGARAHKHCSGVSWIQGVVWRRYGFIGQQPELPLASTMASSEHVPGSCHLRTDACFILPRRGLLGSSCAILFFGLFVQSILQN